LESDFFSEKVISAAFKLCEGKNMTKDHINAISQKYARYFNGRFLQLLILMGGIILTLFEAWLLLREVVKRLKPKF